MALDIALRRKSSGFCIFIVYEQDHCSSLIPSLQPFSDVLLDVLVHHHTIPSNHPHLVALLHHLLRNSILSFHHTFLPHPPKERHGTFADLPYTTSTCLYLCTLCLCSRKANQLVDVLSIRGHLLTFPFPSAQMNASEVCGCLRGRCLGG